MASNAIAPAPLQSEVPLWALTPPPWFLPAPPIDGRSGGPASTSPPAPAAKPAEVLQRVWQLARARHYSRRTEKAYASWVRPQPDDINPPPQECPTCGAALHLRFYGRGAPGLAA